MTHAVIQLCGKQYLVTEGEMLTVDRLENPAETKLTITDVLLINKDDVVTVGAPLVDKAKVVLSVMDHNRADKIKVFKYKSKSRYRKTQGHRQLKTVLKVESITG